MPFFSFLFLILSSMAFAEEAQPLVVRASFPVAAAEAAVYERAVTPQEIESWKKRVVSQLFDFNVRQALSSREEVSALPTLNPSPEGVSVFLGELTKFAYARGLYMEPGLLDGLSVSTFKNQTPAGKPFVVDFSIPREPFKQAVKEILYSAGYVEGLDELFSAVAKAKARNGAKIGLAGVIKKAAAIKVASGVFRQASTFLETGTLESLEKQEWMDKVGPAVDKHLNEDLEVWAKLFCVFTSSQ